MSTLVAFVFTGLMVAAIITDSLEQRIPNRLTYAGIALGLLLRVPAGPLEILLGVSGVLIGFGLALPLFVLGAIGGGDVKLLSVIGAFMGPLGLLQSLLVAALLGLVLAVVWGLARGTLLPALLRTRELLRYALSGGRAGSLPPTEGTAALTVPYGIALAGGALIAWFTPVAGLLS